MISVTFGKISNQTNVSLVLSHFTFQKNAFAQQEHLVEIKPHETIMLAQLIDLQLMDTNVGNRIFTVVCPANPSLELIISISWGGALYIDMRIENRAKEETIDLKTVQKNIRATDKCSATINLDIAGKEFEKSSVEIIEIIPE